MASKQVKRYTTTLIAFFVLVAMMLGGLAAGVQWTDKASWTPKLALDLAGGTQIILKPEAMSEDEQKNITQETINEAIEVMRKRVDSKGVSEASVSSLGGSNIVVELPGKPEEQAEIRELVRRSASMDYRPVITMGPAGVQLQPEGTATPSATSGESPSGDASPSESSSEGASPSESASSSESASPSESSPSESASPSPSTSSDNGRFPVVRSNETPSETSTTTDASATSSTTTPAEGESSTTPAEGESTPSATGSETAATPSAPAQVGPVTPTDASDPNHMTPAIMKEFEALDCTKLDELTGRSTADPKKPLVTCSDDGIYKYVLGPVEVRGDSLKNAYGGPERNSQGQQTSGWAVYSEFDAEGAEGLYTMTKRITSLPEPRNMFGIVLDGVVISSPRSRAVIPNGSSVISGDFTQESATELANQIKFGALPLSFVVETESQITASLGKEQLERGLLAGLIGLGLVVLYSLFQYRTLGLVTVASLLVAGTMTYLAIALLAWYNGYRLSLPGVTGLIVAIGITTDSFIVYFERIRDELRDGRPLASAVEAAWSRARRTIIISDCINFLAAAVLYLLAVGGVQGFAFTLGLTTLIDLIIVLFFTHPLIGLLARLRFFASGHPLSGFSEAQLTDAPTYAGRGRLRTPADKQAARMTLAEKKALEADESGDVKEDA